MSSIFTERGVLRDNLWIKKTASAYTPAQVTQWLSRIGFQERCTEENIHQGRVSTTLENLCIITRLQLVSFVYENTEMHYSADHVMDISFEGLYRRMIIEGKGSYCFGLNGLFFQMLRGLGYRVYTGAARINIASEASSPPNYTAHLHMVIFVQPVENSNITYLVDVGCGGSGPARPILLSNAVDNIVLGVSPSEKHRLTRGAHPGSSLGHSLDSESPLDLEWHLEVLHEKPGSPSMWRVVYSFTEKEFFPSDFESANLTVYTMRAGLFWDNVVCSKHFWLEDGMIDDEQSSSPDTTRRYLGRIGMEGNMVRRHIGSDSQVLRIFSTEQERADTLREIFGLDISEENLINIRGRGPELK